MNNTLGTEDASEHLGLIHKYSFTADLTAPLIYLIHGRAGNVDVMWLFRRILPEGVNIISVQAPEQDAIGGWSWWSVTAPDEEIYAEALKNTQRAVSFIERAPKYYNLTPSKTAAIGFSQGSGMISLLVQDGRIRFDAIAILAGFLMRYKEKESGTYSWPPVFWGHGSQDDTIPIERAYRHRDILLEQGASVEFLEEEVGHKIGSQTMKQLKSWLAEQMS